MPQLFLVGVYHPLACMLATNNMLKTVYQHTIKEKELEYDAQIDSYFEQLIEPG